MNSDGGPPLAVIACRVFQGLLENYIPESLVKEVIWLDYGLHSVPKKLKQAIQEQIDALPQPSLVVLGYGLCGNGLHQIKAGPHTLLIPRTDDCIAILLGSYEAYREAFDAAPGTYYLTKGWLEAGSNPLEEHRKLEAKYGPEQTAWLMDTQYRHYKRLTFVSHQPQDLEQYRSRALEVAEYCRRWNMEYHELLGSDQYIRRLAQVAQALDQAGHDFLVVPPGGALTQSMFLRW